VHNRRAGDYSFGAGSEQRPDALQKAAKRVPAMTVDMIAGRSLESFLKIRG
jgi:hypothetical protein